MENINFNNSDIAKDHAHLQELKPLVSEILNKYAVTNVNVLTSQYNNQLTTSEQKIVRLYTQLTLKLNSGTGLASNKPLKPFSGLKMRKPAPEVTTPLRNSIIEMPDVIRNATGIVIYGKRIKSIVYSLDVSLIANTDADAILCVYPFTPNTQILNAVALVAKSPILVGVGGGLTQGERSARLASHAEENNASGIVLNGPVTVETTKTVREYVDIPVIYTVIDKSRPLQPYIDAGINIFNVSGGGNTIELVKWVRNQYPDFPIIASGGKTDESIQATIDAGANAITYTAFGAMEEYFHKKMESYRKPEEPKDFAT